jgi:glucosamine-6-phosphate deaminase
VEIIILHSEEEVYREAAERIISLVNRRPDAVLGLATGRTMLGIYEGLREAYQNGRVNFSSVVTVNLDEYLGISPDDPLSFHHYMREHFFKHVNIKKENRHIPDPLPEDVDKECEDYEDIIKRRGGIDLQLLGIGKDGHIGFNEPSSSLQARTRVKTLTDETLIYNFGSMDGPRFAITMGIGTIMEAKEIVLIALGKEKADAVSRAVEGPVTASCPASALQLHPVAKVILDQDAARLLKRKDYYRWVWEHKRQVEKPSLLYKKRRDES